MTPFDTQEKVWMGWRKLKFAFYQIIEKRHSWSPLGLWEEHNDLEGSQDELTVVYEPIVFVKSIYVCLKFPKNPLKNCKKSLKMIKISV